MGKRLLKLFISGLLLLFAGTCVKSVEEAEGPAPAMRLRVCGESVKSSLGLEEDRVTDLNVYVYLDGLLVTSSYGKASEVFLDLVPGLYYRFYALANAGRVEPPSEEEGLAAVCIGTDVAGALPMATRTPVEFCPSSGNAVLLIRMERLFCKVRLTLETEELNECEYSVTSVALRQTACAVSPFASGSCALNTSNGDSASEVDVRALNEGRTICFYAPENCQGVLLPDNEDPFEKVLEGYPEEELCTFLEVNGNWSTLGARSGLQFRMFLGEDNHSDFSLKGNAVLDVTLKLTDEATVMSNWKINTNDYEDERYLRFGKGCITLNSASGVTSVPIESYPPGLKYSIDSDGQNLSGFGLNYSVIDSELQISTTYVGDHNASLSLWVTTWDNVVRDELFVCLEGSSGLFDKFDLDLPRYPYQFGSIYFPESGENPVKFSVGGIDWWVGETDSYESYTDPSGWRFELCPSESRIYLSCESFSQKSATVEMYSNGLRSSITIPPALMPDYSFPSLTLTEAGDGHYDGDNGIWYDQLEKVYLTDSDGARLDLHSFAVPDALLKGRCQSLCDENRYGQLLKAYSDNLIVDGQSNLMGYEKLDSRDVGYEICSDDVLCRLYFYGVADTGGKTVKSDYSVSNSGYPSAYEAERNSVVIKPAFPAQRYLGEVTNMSLAHGWMRSSTASVKFDKAGVYSPFADYPCGNIEWNVLHAGFEELDVPARVEGRKDAYVRSVSFAGNTFNFSEPTETDPPCCGGLLLQGSVRNPHTGTVIKGAYTVDVILRMTVGASVDSMEPETPGGGKIGYSFVPFNEFGLKRYSRMWKGCLPPFLAVIPGENSTACPVCPPESAEENSCFFCSETPIQLNALKSKFCFDFYLNGERKTSLEIRRGTMLKYPTLSEYDDGRAGYYKLTRHYSEWPGTYVLQLMLASSEVP